MKYGAIPWSTDEFRRSSIPLNLIEWSESCWMFYFGVESWPLFFWKNESTILFGGYYLSSFEKYRPSHKSLFFTVINYLPFINNVENKSIHCKIVSREGNNLKKQLYEGKTTLLK